MGQQQRDSKGEQPQLKKLKGVAAKDLNEEQHQSKELKGVAAKDSNEEQHQLKELKGVAAKDSKEEQHQLKELRGVAAKWSIRGTLHLLAATPGKWAQNPPKKWTLSKKPTVQLQKRLMDGQRDFTFEIQ